jgi:hypothetical protein
MLQWSKQAARSRFRTVEFEYRRRYNLAATDPRFLDNTVEDMLIDIFSHRFADNPSEANAIEDEGFDLQAQLDAINAEAEAEAAQASDINPEWENMSPHHD